MKQLTRKLPATSLLETIVSSIIFMILFMIAMHSMTNLLVYENRQTADNRRGIGIIVAFILIAMYIPMFKLGQTMQ